MKNYKFMLRVLGFALACTVGAAAGDAPKLTFTFTKANIPGALQTHTYGVNNAGVMVGAYRDKSSGHGYILNGKKLTNLDDPKAQPGSTIANGLNPNGAISVVGGYNTPDGVPVGFLYKNGKYTDIPGPEGALQSFANSINDSGAIVGWYVDSSDVMHGFLLKGEKYTTLDVPGATEGNHSGPELGVGPTTPPTAGRKSEACPPDFDISQRKSGRESEGRALWDRRGCWHYPLVK
jgi:hypothetical protein